MKVKDENIKKGKKSGNKKVETQRVTIHLIIFSSSAQKQSLARMHNSGDVLRLCDGGEIRTPGGALF